MAPEQILLVRQSFARATRIAPHLAATFYSELFAQEPALRELFKGDMIAQGQKLITMLDYAITHLDAPEAFQPILHELAQRHVAYGVEARHYDLVGIALMRTLRHELAGDYTAETRAAWGAAYQLISKTMREAAYGQTPTP